MGGCTVLWHVIEANGFNKTWINSVREVAMSIGDIIKQKQSSAATLVLAILAILAGVLGYRSFADAGGDRAVGKAFYSVDDGRSYFVDDADKIIGFDHGGEPAYRAYVFRAEGGAPFVGYLERFTPEARERITQRATSDRRPDAAAMCSVPTSDRQIKKPGGSRWYSRRDPQASEVIRIQAPGEPTAALEPVLP